MAVEIDRQGFLGLAAAATLSGVTACTGASGDERAGSTFRGVPPAPSIDQSADVIAPYRAGSVDVDLAGNTVRTWGYSDSVPGKLMRTRAGDVVQVAVDDALDAATSIHWHGLAIPNAMDGVPGLTQPAIAPGASFTYRFEVQGQGGTGSSASPPSSLAPPSSC